MRVRTEAKRDAIMDVAKKLFLEKGYGGTSMAAINESTGGSKSTLYGYFPSKEQLFIEVARSQGARILEPVLYELAQSTEDLEVALHRFGEKYVGFVTDSFALAVYRMVAAESGQGEFGLRFYEAGPKRVLEAITDYLLAAMDAGRLRKGDPRIAADHLVGLLECELWPKALLRLIDDISPAQIKQAVARAIEVFLRGYAPAPAAPDAGS